MKTKEQTYLLKGTAFSQAELELFCSKKIAENEIEVWEKESYLFILEWFSPALTINAYTSGSTGKPKEILLEKKYMRASALATIDFFKLKPENKALLCLPAKYIAGKMMIVRALIGGLDLFLTKPTSVPEISNFRKIDFCAMAPNQVAGLLDTKKGADLLERIQKLIVGGSFLPENLELKIRNLKIEVWQTYGMTETMTHIALRKINGENADYWYTPLTGVIIRLDNRGCLIISAEQIGVNLLVTNDMAELFGNGKFRILGRSDNVIISGGVKLFPEEIEKKLSGWIENDYYIGSCPDEKLGSKLLLYIEDRGKLKKQIYQLWEKIEARLSGYEIPKEIIFSNQFNRTTSGKIIRK